MAQKLLSKRSLWERAPYSTLIGTDYIDFLESNLSELYQGNIGIYLSREVQIENQKLYFPFIDIIDPFLTKENNTECELITDSILRTKILIQSFSELSILGCFNLSQQVDMVLEQYLVCFLTKKITTGSLILSKMN